MSETKILLGLDYGAKRIGVARGNTLARLAVPYLTVEVKGDEIDVIKKIVRDENIEMLVVGLPRGLNAQETDQTKKTREFAKQLENIGVSVVMQDEAGTTKQAEAELKNQKSGSKHSIDAISAAIILQDYLDLL